METKFINFFLQVSLKPFLEGSPRFDSQLVSKRNTSNWLLPCIYQSYLLAGLTVEADVQAYSIKVTVASIVNLMSGQYLQMKFAKLQVGALSISFQNICLDIAS